MTIAIYGEALIDDFLTEQVVGGAPFNVARHLAAFMAPQVMITRIGDDRYGAVIREEFDRFAMSAAGLQTDLVEETGRVVVERGLRGHRFVILPQQAYDFINPEKALEALEQAAPDLIYYGTLAQRARRSRETLHALLDATDARRFLDLNLRDGQVDERTVFQSMHAADIVKVNEEELQQLFAWYVNLLPTTTLDSDEVRSACTSIVRQFGLEGLIVTLGHRGSAWIPAEGDIQVQRDNPQPPFVIDTVGAGDAFAAIFILGLQRRWSIEQCLARANEFAGAICAIPGAVPRELKFYDKWVARWGTG